jgi:hypothetical protein
MKYRLVVTAAAAVALTVAPVGCAGIAPPATEAPPVLIATPPPVTPTASPEPIAEVAQRPASVFGGSCDSVISPSMVKSLFGAKYSASEWGLADPATAIVPQVGGLMCEVSRSGASGIDTWLVVTPAAATDESSESLECTDEVPDQESCYGDHFVNGYRLSFHVGRVVKTSTSKVVTTKIIAHFDEAAAANPVAIVTPQSTAWANPVDCDDLGPRVDIGEALGTTGKKWKTEVPGRDWEFPKVVSDLWGGAYFLSCSWMAKSSVDNPAWVEVAVLGGGAWAADAVAAQETATEVDPGEFDRAILVESLDADPAWATLNVFTGVNWLAVDVHLSGKFGKRIDVAAAVAEALT